MIPVNNELYDELGERWYTACDHPVALLRSEGRARNPWIAEQIRRTFPDGPVRVIDVGCGAGFLSNRLASEGFAVTGIDASVESLETARLHDDTKTVRYLSGDACDLPFQSAAFEAACAMDFLEHVERPDRVIAECSRVLRPGGMLFFSTFQRNLLSWLVAIKGVEWFVKNTPDRLHDLHYFINSGELRTMCGENGLRVRLIRGLNPKLDGAFLRMVLTGEVPEDFSFRLSRFSLIGYIGIAVREGLA